MAGLNKGIPPPTEIKLHQKSRVLEITFADGARFRLPCELLRAYSPSAEVRGHDTGNYSWDLLYDYGTRQDEMWRHHLKRMEEAGASREPTPAKA